MSNSTVSSINTLELIAKEKKLTFISTGMSTKQNIDDAAFGAER